MEEHIDQIETFLRGQMSLEEEDMFKKSLRTNVQLRIWTFMVTNILRKKKHGKNLVLLIFVCTFALGNNSGFCSILES